MFEEGAALLAQKWRKSFGGGGILWEWRNAYRRPGESNLASGYLALERYPVRKPLVQQSWNETAAWTISEERSMECASEDTDIACVYEPTPSMVPEHACCSSSCTLSERDAVHLYDYHIVYSPSFCVPTVFFKGYLEGGTELVWDQVVQDMPILQRKPAPSINNYLALLSKEEHPHLRQPWYSLHPCQTATILNLVLARNNEYSQDQDTQVLLIAKENHERFATQADNLNSKAYLLKYMLAWFSIGPASLGISMPAEAFA